MNKKRSIKFIANACLWFDKVNGNTYHSVKITRTHDGKQLFCPMEYGYGEQYRCTALLAMCRAGWLPKRYTEERGEENARDNYCALYDRDNNYPIEWICTHGLKRDCIQNGHK